MEYITMYQLFNEEGDRVLHPYYEKRAAEYMAEHYFKGCIVIEVEIYKGE